MQKQATDALDRLSEWIIKFGGRDRKIRTNFDVISLIILRIAEWKQYNELDE